MDNNKVVGKKVRPVPELISLRTGKKWRPVPDLISLKTGEKWLTRVIYEK